MPLEADRLAIELAGGCIAAIQQYAQMAGKLRAPEGFIRDLCAVHVHQRTGQRIITEHRRRDLTALFGISDDALDEFNNFRTDLMIFGSEHSVEQPSCEAAVELKLWTDPRKLKEDLRRVRGVARAIADATGTPTPKAFVIACPQYGPGARVTADTAVSDLSKFFTFACTEKYTHPEENTDGQWTSAVIVLNADTCNVQDNAVSSRDGEFKAE